MFSYYAAYKPFHCLSQFRPTEGKKSLKDFFNVGRLVYPVGRLDYDSEGLLLLTDDPKINHQLLHPSFAHEREYYVQVEGVVTNQALSSLAKGITLRIDGKDYHTKPAKARILEPPPQIPDRNPPIRFRLSIPTQWISLSLTEGKNRQVRKMTAHVGYPTLRLIRWRMGRIALEGMQPGEMRSIDRETFYSRLSIHLP